MNRNGSQTPSRISKTALKWHATPGTGTAASTRHEKLGLHALHLVEDRWRSGDVAKNVRFHTAQRGETQ